MSLVLATYNIKGGVGKTSAAVNLAHLAARGGARTLLWDLDPQGASTFLFRVKPRIKGGGRKLVRGKSDVDALVKGTDHERLDLLPADFSYRHMDLALDATKRPTQRLGRVLAPLAGDYDYVFLDCPPSISLVSESVFEAADALLVPLIPATLSAAHLRAAPRAGRGRAAPAGVLLDGRRPQAHAPRGDRRSGRARTPRYSVPRSPRRPTWSAWGVRRTAITDFAPRSRAARAYERLWSEVQERLEPPRS